MHLLTFTVIPASHRVLFVNAVSVAIAFALSHIGEQSKHALPGADISVEATDVPGLPSDLRLKASEL
eukprot:m.318652 g.318652  ORF g.318652 m.318652 type:complete len:67 (-) comp20290_c0_seq15:4826-5026(-)